MVASDTKGGEQKGASCEIVKHGVYVYGLVYGDPTLRLGNIGIEDSEVYIIPCGGFSALVHDCAQRPYESKDTAVVERWVRQHEKVLEVAMSKFESVIPFRFNTIVKSDNPPEALSNWVSSELTSLRKKMDRIKGRREYGVQILYSSGSKNSKSEQKGEGAKSLSSPISRGAAYLYRLKSDKSSRMELESNLAAYCKDLYPRIKEAVAEVKLAKTRRTQENGLSMLMNLSVLADEAQSGGLSSLLDKIQQEKEGFTVRFTGPWPPYSFV